MSYYDDDFYHEPSEFDELVDDFKESLMKSVKEDYVNKMDQLRKENEELQVVKKDFENIKNSYTQKENDLERTKSKLKSEVRRERLSELLKDFQVTMYSTTTTHKKQEKCDKCDDNRRVKYQTPSGKDAFEACKCDEKKYYRIPKEMILTEFNNTRGMSAWYKPYSEDRDGYSMDYSSTYAKSIYKKDDDMSKLDVYDTLFKNIEDCQKYCDYLNSLDGSK